MALKITFVCKASCFTAVYNLVGCPAGILPVTMENALDQAALADYQTFDTQHETAKKACIGANGCPIGVQVLFLSCSI